MPLYWQHQLNNTDMDIITICILGSSLSFFAYVISYFISPHMKNEFKRFELENLGLFIILLELSASAGLIIGLIFKPILLISSFGLALLMLLGLLVRIKLKDNIWISLPALFYMLLNTYIFLASIK